MFERSHLSIGGVLGHGTVTTTPRYLDGNDCLVPNYNLNFLHVSDCGKAAAPRSLPNQHYLISTR